MKPTFAQIFFMLICLLTANTSFAYIDPPILFPANPTADQSLFIRIEAGVCDAFPGSVDDGNVTRVGTNIRMYLGLIRQDSMFCYFPGFNFRFNIGRLPPGTYNLTVVVHSVESFPGPETDETVGTLSFVVSPGANEAVPALDPWWMTVLVAGLCLAAAPTLWNRRPVRSGQVVRCSGEEMRMNQGDDVNVNQHWVPQFYLANFATTESVGKKNRQVWVTEKTTQPKREYLTAVRNVCAKRYLYSPEGKDGVRDHSIDRLITEIESEVSTIWESIASGTIDFSSTTAKKVIAFFAAVMHVRNFLLYDLTEKILQGRNMLWGEPSQEFIDNLAPGSPDPTHAGRFFNRELVQLIPKARAVFENKNWVVLETDSAVFLTSDRPIAFWGAGGRKGVLGAKDTVTLFPLSPQRMLFMGNDGEVATARRALSRSEAIALNGAIYAGATKLVIADRPWSKISEEFESLTGQLSD